MLIVSFSTGRKSGVPEFLISVPPMSSSLTNRTSIFLFFFLSLVISTLYSFTTPIPPIDTWKFTSQLGEDATILHDLFYKKGVGALAHGIYLEVGAVDGIDLSNTLIFEKYLNWTGILIEGCPTMKEALWKNRPIAHKFSKAVCPTSQSPRVIQYGGCGHSAGIVGSHGDEHTKKSRNYHGAGYEVPCAPMKEMIAESGVSHIDLMSIDVEGYELPLLRSIDFEAIPIRAVVIEVNHNAPHELKLIRDLFHSKGFVSHGLCSWAYANEIWVNPSFQKPLGAGGAVGDVMVPVEWDEKPSQNWRLRPCRAPPSEENLELVRKRDAEKDSTGFEEYVASFRDPTLWPAECKHAKATHLKTTEG
jgi:FkbM family methyltransferase